MSTRRPWRSPFLALCATIVAVTLALALSWRCGTMVRQGEDGAWRGVRFLPPTISISSSSAASSSPTPLRARPTFSLHPLPPLLPAEDAAAFDPRLAAAAAAAAADSSSIADSAASSSAATLPRLQDALRGALITAVAGGTPAILSFAASPSSSSSSSSSSDDSASAAASAEADPSTHLEPYLRSLALVGGPELASTAVVACADDRHHVQFAPSQITGEQVDTIARKNIAKIVEMTKNDHIAFVDKIAKAVAGEHSMQATDLATHHTCRLGKWYDTVTDDLMGSLPAYADLAEPHREVHTYGRQVLIALESEQTELANTRLQELRGASSRVLAILDRLRDEYQQGRRRHAA